MTRQPEVGEIPEDIETQLVGLQKEFDDIQVQLLKESTRLQAPLFDKRAELLSKVDGFWPQALTNCIATNVYIDDDDHQLLDSLTKIDVKRNPDDLRGALIEFHFKPNDFISDSVLVKEFKADPDSEPFSVDFDFAADTVPVKTQINWKSDDKNLSKLKPTVGDLKEVEDEEDEEPDFEPGSFFSSFFDSESRQVAGSIGRAIVEEFFPFAVEHFRGEMDDEEEFDEDDEDEDEDDDEEDEEDEDDDQREIDLEEEERPRKKGRK
ncbi:hypothetical protein MCUN1_000730 [Malassezia cuniculi]|uniref:Nucleosome assembly protein n=1 Tax=Malassezia cuniculi TaxID=948313 RepID=A0AAF0ES88_9BASI|nr:hypothetical protein MCUN1_000730 [Malassezia cuniculi]